MIRLIWFVKTLFLLIAFLSVGGQANGEAYSLGHYQLHGKEVPVGEDGIHDPNNDALEILQPPYTAMVEFPRRSNGVIDWVAALDNGLINPRVDLHGEEKLYAVDLDIIMKNTASMPYVRYPHLPHTKWLACKNCHPAVFLPKKGSNFVNMSAIMRGQSCGLCHGKVAFPPLECNRCHSIPKEQGGLR